MDQKDQNVFQAQLAADPDLSSLLNPTEVVVPAGEAVVLEPAVVEPATIQPTGPNPSFNCADCLGSGLVVTEINPDGKICVTCGGTGKV